ncbi:MAG TPA: kelch repeat-containing protein, partial [Solirubrobacteraceae bacterium]|nr:kelch repeat-containing protein [Solirubrobacteraceae bacterium]
MARTALVPLVAAAALLAACGSAGEDRRAPEPAAARWTTEPRATIARTEVAAARVGRFVFVVGGFAAPDGATTDVVERYDLVRRRWRRVAPLPVPLNHAAAASDGRRLYVVGGYAARSSLDDEVATLYRYDPERDRWSRLRSSPTTRGAHAVGVIGHRLYVVGGVRDGEALRTLE